MANLIYGGTSYPLAAGIDQEAFTDELHNAFGHSSAQVPAVATFPLTSGGTISVAVDRGVPIAFTS